MLPDLKSMPDEMLEMIANLSEGRILSIDKDALRMDEKQLLWSEQLEKEVYSYWSQLNMYWDSYQDVGALPSCTCADHENGFLAREAYNPYFYEGEPCSIKYFDKWKKEKE